jgi:hypothetical protein
MSYHFAEHAISPWAQLRAVRATPNQILRAVGVLTPPVDVRDIASRLGIAMHEVPSPGWSGAVQSGSAGAHIWVPGEDAEVRKRFTIAHEIGHLMLHPDVTQFRDTNFRGDPQEASANRFAAALLMPAWMLEHHARALGFDLDELARRFFVSRDAMKYRLLNLGYAIE